MAPAAIAVDARECRAQASYVLSKEENTLRSESSHCRALHSRTTTEPRPMPQSLAQILVHLVFSTKNRERILADDVHDDLHAYIGGIVRNHDGTLLKAGSVADHIHLLISHPRTSAPSRLVQEVKTGSSAWLKTTSSRYARFHWQGGYGIFSVSPSHRKWVESYLSHQAEHHRLVTFQDEFRRLLRKYEVPFDERYVWD